MIHIICAFLLVLGAQFLLPLWQAALAVFVLGVGKELWDSSAGTGFCWYDIAANSVGIAFTMLCLHSIA